MVDAHSTRPRGVAGGGRANASIIVFSNVADPCVALLIFFNSFRCSFLSKKC